MVGNVGGYIGLCLGYSFLQIPDLILWIIQKLKKYFPTLRSRRNSVGPFPLRMVANEPQLENRPDSEAHNQDLELELNKLKERMDKLTERLNK